MKPVKPSLADAILVVLTDQRESMACGPATAVGHVLNTISVDELNMDDPTGEAYKMVLEARKDLLVEQIALMLEIEPSIIVLTFDDSSWPLIDGMDAFEWLAALGEDDE